MSEDLKRNGAFIPGVKPGRKTAEFLDDILARITLPGSIFLAIVAILPAIATVAGVNSQFAQFYGGTSLLIIVVVTMDFMAQVQNYMMSQQYDSLLKKASFKS